MVFTIIYAIKILPESPDIGPEHCDPEPEAGALTDLRLVHGGHQPGALTRGLERGLGENKLRGQYVMMC